ncbi:SPT3 Dosage dependent suppressor of Ty-induced promoter mutations-like protein [Dispira parvispora]|uniref:SPT3 Dosage dependent suppressor of Ty-induced promoter mutations-like protein n=1 Tax=Dispira parvispora TaxID=1520584 RepID=A0A9W8ATA3_9FUNG|nr:SPT3 Dosage dependent suppressor of Ty-induced promoter mutations-like protein [Dispira parvispora]
MLQYSGRKASQAQSNSQVTSPTDDTHAFHFTSFLSPVMAAATGTSQQVRGRRALSRSLTTDHSPFLDPVMDELNLDSPLVLSRAATTTGAVPLPGVKRSNSHHVSPSLPTSRASSPGFTGSSSFTTPQMPQPNASSPGFKGGSTSGLSPLARAIGSAAQAKVKGKKPERSGEIDHHSPVSNTGGAAEDDGENLATLHECLRRFRGHCEEFTEARVMALMQRLPTSLAQDVLNRQLRIVMLGIPRHGAKSRVETQIRLGLQLLDSRGDQVTHWSHLRLPDLSVVKDRTRNRQGHLVEPSPLPPDHQILSLEATVVCASAPTKRVDVCMGCVRREFKRAQRRKENRCRAFPSNATTPAQSRPGSPTSDHHQPPSMESEWDEERINLERRRTLIFNCYDIVDFHKGEVHLPARITCYCRHHAEKVGFCIYLVIRDYTGTVLATGLSPPIMITDDHKSTKFKSERKRPKAEYDVEGRLQHKTQDKPVVNTGHEVGKGRRSVLNSPATLQPSMVTTSSSTSAIGGDPPLPPLSAAVSGGGRHTSGGGPTAGYTGLAGFHSISNTPLGNNTPLPSPLLAAQLSPPATPHFPPNMLPLNSPSFPTGSPSSYPQSTLMAPPDRLISTFGSMPIPTYSPFVSSGQDAFLGANSVNVPDFALLNDNHAAITQILTSSQSASPQSSVFSNQFSPIREGVQLPKVDRIVPTEGPVNGGIEVTLLGVGFHENLRVLFGDAPAKITHFWSPNTMVCVLPPSTVAGPVMVTLGESLPGTEFPLDAKESIPLFTYVDDTERQLMELALQVVGIKMTGRVEDPRQVAMRIVAAENQNTTGGSTNTSPSQSDITKGGQGEHHSQSSMATPPEEDVLMVDSGINPVELSLQYFHSSPANMQLLKNILNAYRSRNLDRLEEALLQLFESLRVNFTLDEVSLSVLHDKTNQTLLHLAAILGMSRLARFLLANHMRTDVQDGNGMTALHFAAWVGHVEMVLLLLDAGASHSLMTFNSKRPIDLASARSLNDVVLLLEQREDYMSFLCDSDWETDETALESMASSFTSTTSSLKTLTGNTTTNESLSLFNLTSSVFARMKLDQSCFPGRPFGGDHRMAKSIGNSGSGGNTGLVSDNATLGMGTAL